MDLYSIAVGRLGWPPSEYYESTPVEVYLALNGKNEADRDFFEVMANVISVGYARTQTKSKIELFKDEDKKKDSSKKTAKQNRADLDFLQERFSQ